DPQMDVQVAVTAAPHPDRAPTREPERGAVVDAGRDVGRVSPLLGAPGLAPALRTGAGALLAGAAALGAGRGRHHLAEDRTSDPVDLAAAATLAAGNRAGPRAGPAALAVRTGDRLAEADLALGAGHRRFERELEGDLHVGPAAGAPLAGAERRRPAERAAEERLEEVAQAGAERA